VPDPYSLKSDLEALLGAVRLAKYAPNGTPDQGAYWAARIEFGDRWLDDQFGKVGRDPVPELLVDRPAAMVTILRDWSVVAALHFANLAGGDETKAMERRWKDLLAWLQCGARLGDDGATGSRVKFVVMDADDVCPSIPEKTWSELVPCAGDPRCQEGAPCHE
jgi:hypothetical protein